MNKSKICFVIGSRAHYARIKPIIKYLPESNYRIILIESASISEFGNIAGEIKNDFCNCKVQILFTNISGSNLVTMTKSTGVIFQN